MKVKIHIDPLPTCNFEVPSRSEVNHLKTFTLMSDNIDEAKLWFMDFAGEVMRQLNEMTAVLYPPETEFDPIAAAMNQIGNPEFNEDAIAHVANEPDPNQADFT